LYRYIYVEMKIIWHDITCLLTLVIQINGKVRGSLQVPSIASNDKQALEAYARSSSAAQNYLEGKEIKKVIAVPGKLVNFVVV